MFTLARCAYPDTGLPISGTSRLKESPECDNVVERRTPTNVVTGPENGISSRRPKPTRGKKKDKNRKKRRGRSPFH